MNATPYWAYRQTFLESICQTLDQYAWGTKHLEDILSENLIHTSRIFKLRMKPDRREFHGTELNMLYLEKVRDA